VTEHYLTDESIYAADGASASSAHAIIHDRSKGVFAALLAISVIVNVGTGWIIMNYAKEQRLKQYDLDDFKSRGFSDLNGEVQMHDKLINVLLIRKECLK